MYPKLTNSLAVIALFASLAALACGSNKGEDEGTSETGSPNLAPKISAVEPTYSFDTVKQGQNVEHVFKIKNEGTENLLIEKARGS